MCVAFSPPSPACEPTVAPLVRMPLALMKCGHLDAALWAQRHAFRRGARFNPGVFSEMLSAGHDDFVLAVLQADDLRTALLSRCTDDDDAVVGTARLPGAGPLACALAAACACPQSLCWLVRNAAESHKTAALLQCHTVDGASPPLQALAWRNVPALQLFADAADDAALPLVPEKDVPTLVKLLCSPSKPSVDPDALRACVEVVTRVVKPIDAGLLRFDHGRTPLMLCVCGGLCVCAHGVRA